MISEILWNKDKKLLRVFIGELRLLWAEFDPIGVMGYATEGYKVDDEYDSYLTRTLSSLKSSDQDESLDKFLSWVLNDRMCLDEENVSIEERKAFKAKLKLWFATAEKRVLEVKNDK